MEARKLSDRLTVDRCRIQQAEARDPRRKADRLARERGGEWGVYWDSPGYIVARVGGITEAECGDPVYVAEWMDL